MLGYGWGNSDTFPLSIQSGLRMTMWIKSTVVAVLVLMLAGCMTNNTGTVYSSAEARQVQQVSFGTIIEWYPG